MEANINQVCRDIPVVLAIAAPVEKLEGFAAIVKETSEEVQIIHIEYEQKITDLQTKLQSKKIQMIVKLEGKLYFKSKNKLLHQKSSRYVGLEKIASTKTRQ